MDLKEEHLLGDGVESHWYYRAKRAALLRALDGVAPTSVIDVGAGSGVFSRALLEGTSAARAVCVDPGYPGDRDELVRGKPLSFRRALGETDADLVLMMDVIEHVPDDKALIGEYADKVAPGTRFVVTVPAFMWLWSGHDVFLEHYRRYTLAGLEAVLEASGLRVEQGCYFYGAVLPLVAGVRLAKRLFRASDPPGSDLRTYGPAANRLLFEVSRAETLVMGANRLGGTTVFTRAVKR